MPGSYHIWPLTVVLVYAYLLSLAGVYMGLYSLSAQRKFWNVLLLLAFISTATLGLFFAFQINYKINFKAEDTWMLVHVDSGIALALISIFHFTWHIRYYLGLFKKSGRRKKVKDTKSTLMAMNEIRILKKMKEPVLLLGFSTMVTQVVMIRACLNVFNGNELVIGLILGIWMLLSGAGAWFGSRGYRIVKNSRIVSLLITGIGILPILQLSLLYLLKNIVFLPGSEIGILPVVLFSTFLLLPFCFLSGYAFSFYNALFSEVKGKNLAGKVYAWEAVGSLSGGLVFSLILVQFLKPLQILALVWLANLTLVMLREKAWYRRLGWVFPSLGFLLGVILLVAPADKYLIHFLYPNQEVVFFRETPKGNLVGTVLGDQKNLYEDGILLAASLDPVAVEEDVHYAMIQRDTVQNVLVIGGAGTGMFREVLKYPVKRIDDLELNPGIIRRAERFMASYEDSLIRFKHRDPRNFIRTSQSKYDVVLLHLPPPSTAQINRLYTREFYRALKKRLTPSGVVSLGIPYAQNYLGEEGFELAGSVFKTLKQVFDNVEIIPGEKLYFLASGKPLTRDIALKISAQGIKNNYVSPDYIMDDLLKMRSRQIREQISNKGKTNTDAYPVAFFSQITYWLSYFGLNAVVIGTIVFLFFFILLLRMNRLRFGMMAAGFTSSGTEILLIFVFQVVFGNSYLMMAVIFSVFMAGLALGSGINTLKVAFLPEKLPNIPGLLLILALGAALLPAWLFIPNEGMVPGLIMVGLMLVHIFLMAFITGNIFQASALKMTAADEKHVPGIYSADLAGGAFGAILVVAFILPLTGILWSGIFVALPCLLASGITRLTRE